MDFNSYQKQSKSTALYPKQTLPIYPVLGLASEAGEVAGKLKKIIRDSGGKLTADHINDFKSELGDVLWYLAQIATELQLSLDDIAHHNLDKLALRKAQNKLSGSGDHREDWGIMKEEQNTITLNAQR